MKLRRLLIPLIMVLGLGCMTVHAEEQTEQTTEAAETEAAGEKTFGNPWRYDGTNEESILRKIADWNNWGTEYTYDKETRSFEGKTQWGDDFSGCFIEEDGKVSVKFTDYYGEGLIEAKAIEELADNYDDDTLREDHSNIEELLTAMVRHYAAKDAWLDSFFWEMTVDEETCSGTAKGDENDVVPFTFSYDHLGSGEEVIRITFEDGVTYTNDDIRD